MTSLRVNACLVCDNVESFQRPEISMTMTSDVPQQTVFIDTWDRDDEGSPIYGGLAYVRRDCGANGSWTGASRAATPFTRRSAVPTQQPPPDHVETRAARRKRVPHASREEAIRHSQLMHRIAAPERTFAPLSYEDPSRGCYRILKVGGFFFVTIVVSRKRGTLSFNSARALVYRMAPDGVSVDTQPVENKDFTELPYSVELRDISDDVYHVKWELFNAPTDTDTMKYISEGVDNETAQDVLRCMAHYGLAAPS